MKNKLAVIYTAFCILSIPLSVAAQQANDTIRVMSYNTLNYGFPATSGCPALLTANKHVWLRKIIQYTNPDILGLEKMTAEPASFTADTIISAVLDSVCGACYSHTPYTNVSGYQKEDMLYFRNDRFGWIRTTTIYAADTNISDINLHELYYKPAGQEPGRDTVFLNVILAHLKSGSGSAAERSIEISGAMNWLNAHISNPGNYIFMGDFNTQSSAENCFQQLINSTNPNTLFVEPTGQLGNWNANPTAFANYLTQSTRTTDPGDCGAVGGQDDWFDHLLCSTAIMQGSQAISYIPGSFYVVAQDGQHVNKSLLASPLNTTVPADILSALYYMSEHLPVMMQLAIDTFHIANGIIPLEAEVQWQYNTLVTTELRLCTKINRAITNHNCQATIYDFTGRLVHKQAINFNQSIIAADRFAQGAYLLVITSDDQPVFNGRFVKVSN